ncbi:sigma-70 family RNA polymerase sigma factor [Actinophytocola sp. KF-1]
MSSDGDAPISDEPLIAAVRRGEVDAYAQLYRKHEEPARRTAQLCAGDHADQQDLVAEAFVRVLVAILGGGGPRDDLRPYLLVAIRNLASSHWQRERRVDRYGAGAEAAADAEVTPCDQIVVGRWRERVLWEAFRELPPRWRAVLWHMEVNGAHPSDLAPTLGLSPNGVSALAVRAREGLRKAFLQAQVPEASDPRCQAARERMGPWLRAGLEARKVTALTRHLAGCAACRAVAAELAEANRELRSPTGVRHQA